MSNRLKTSNLWDTYTLKVFSGWMNERYTRP
jgi:hypothetical protein